LVLSRVLTTIHINPSKMLVYKDVISNDEMFTEAYDIKLVDDVLYKVAGNQKTEKFTVDESAIGGNKSAEGEDADEGVEDQAVSGLDIVLNNRLKSTLGMTKKDYKTYIKAYIKRVKEWLQENKPERVEDFEKNALKGVQAILKNYSKYEFYTGESGNQDAMLILLDWGDDDNTPTFTFFKDGLFEEKY